MAGSYTLKPAHDPVRTFHHTLINKVWVGAATPSLGAGIGELILDIPQADGVPKHPAVDVLEQLITGVEPVEIAVEH